MDSFVSVGVGKLALVDSGSTVDFRSFCMESTLRVKSMSCLSCQLLYTGQWKLVNPRHQASLTLMIGLSLVDTIWKCTGFTIDLYLTNTLQVPTA